MKYDEYRYLWPPRPERAIPANLIPTYCAMKWGAQVKKNGTNTLIFARNGEVIFKDRHEGDHAAWKPLPAHTAFFAGAAFHANRWQVYCAELLHSKTPHIKNELYLFDVIVADGEHLAGMTFEERQRLLALRFPGAGAPGFGAVRVAQHIQRAESIPADVLNSYRDPARMAELAPEDEGFVFKNPKAPLLACLTARANGGWQVKCRRPHKNYSF